MNATRTFFLILAMFVIAGIIAMFVNNIWFLAVVLISLGFFSMGITYMENRDICIEIARGEALTKRCEIALD